MAIVTLGKNTTAGFDASQLLTVSLPNETQTATFHKSYLNATNYRQVNFSGGAWNATTEEYDDLPSWKVLSVVNVKAGVKTFEATGVNLGGLDVIDAIVEAESWFESLFQTTPPTIEQSELQDQLASLYLILSGNDTITGTTGHDNFFGGLGNDILKGGAGNDRIHGNSGNDTFYGGAGNDELLGGQGLDTFVFDSVLNATTNVDRLAFNPRDDIMKLDNDVFLGLAVGALAATAFHIGTAAADAGDRIIYNKTLGEIYFDRDGSGTAYAKVLFAEIVPKTVLTSLDFSILE